MRSTGSEEEITIVEGATDERLRLYQGRAQQPCCIEEILIRNRHAKKYNHPWLIWMGSYFSPVDPILCHYTPPAGNPEGKALSRWAGNRSMIHHAYG